MSPIYSGNIKIPHTRIKYSLYLYWQETRKNYCNTMHIDNIIDYKITRKQNIKMI